jgi:hypothetical protein
MRDDLLEAHAAVHWAKTQRHALQERIIKWNQSYPYELVPEDDRKTGYKLLVVYMQPVDPMIVAEVGAIINMTRSALDLLCSALSIRRGCIKPRETPYFPIRKFVRDFRATAKDIERKKWFTAADLAKIKALRPYKRGNMALYALSQLDNLRKHTRFLKTDIAPGDFRYFPIIGHREEIWFRKGYKTIIFRYSPGTFLPIAPGNHSLTVAVTINEPSIGIRNAPIMPLIDRFSERVSEIIRIFDT